jgi:small subunit ribosomal protein S17
VESEAVKTTQAAGPRTHRKVRTGRVVSNKMQKTIIVAVERLLKHPLYGRVIKRTSKIYAHDERGEAAPGDLVRVMETRPMSRLKRWRLLEIVERAN